MWSTDPRVCFISTSSGLENDTSDKLEYVDKSESEPTAVCSSLPLDFEKEQSFEEQLLISLSQPVRCNISLLSLGLICWSRLAKNRSKPAQSRKKQPSKNIAAIGNATSEGHVKPPPGDNTLGGLFGSVALQ
jgi:hypothetical protein